MAPPSRYEREQYEALCRWRDRPPAFIGRTAARATGPVGRAVGALIPASALRLALQTVEATARQVGDQRSILRRAKVNSLNALATGSLEPCDVLSRHVARRSMLMAGSSGALFGVAGGLGLAADVPTLLVIAFRSIYRVGLCYGEDCMTGDRQLPLAVFALASANNQAEKQVAWDAVCATAGPDVASAAVRGSALRAAHQSVVKSTATLGFSRVARQVGTRLGWRMAAEAVPVAGAFVGGSVNVWYLRDVSAAAQRAFRWRWLAVRHPKWLAAQTGAA